jgi:phosphoribosylformimino-5-aminoimidazole carboxamide ribotide isomerase
VRVIGVLDLLGGKAVHARAGRRDAYLPVSEVAGLAFDPGDAVALARTYNQMLGVRELYAADLDAILGKEGQRALVAKVVACGAPLWLDAAVSTAESARDALALGVARAVVGLETLGTVEQLREICDAIGGERVAFSLDLRDGKPLGRDGVFAGGEAAHTIAARAAHAGAGALIVLDLARVGLGAGVDMELMRRVREAAPDVALFAGGGVRDFEDLARLDGAGCDGALVATALLDGRLDASDVAMAHALPPRR